MENKIIELRNWFRMNGEMDFEQSGKKEDTGKFITYKCTDIESIFAGVLANVGTSEKDLRVCEVVASAWISVKEQLPNDEDYCLFAFISQGVIIKDYASQFSNIKKFRSYELKYQYTHWIQLQEPPK